MPSESAYCRRGVTMSFDRTKLPQPSEYFEGLGLAIHGPRNAKWRATECQIHGGSDSLRFNTESGGWLCMACGAKGGDVLAHHIQVTGSDFVTAAKALGAWMDDGKPAPSQKPSPLSYRQALALLAFEIAVAAMVATDVVNGRLISDEDALRIRQAAERITFVQEVLL